MTDEPPARTRRRRNHAPVRGAEVWRGPAAGGLSLEPLRQVTTLDRAHADDTRPGFALCFMIPAGGSGGTALRVWIGPDGFADLAEAMRQADPAAAEAAFGVFGLKNSCRDG